MKSTVRIYGHQLGYSSFSQVTRGFVRALAARDLFGGFVPIDFFDEEMEYPGALCPVSVNTGMPGAVAQSKLLGQHKERYLLLAPNSDLIPPSMREWIPKILTGLLGPSRWACQVLRRMVPELPIYYVPHGVHPEYDVLVEEREKRLDEYGRGQFTVLHMTSTNSQRKGTKELLEAWAHMKDASLRIVCRFEGQAELRSLVSKLGLENVEITPSNGADYESVNQLYATHHVLCQPSRAEGFGLCPLEAKAAGVPVVMTDCTGHSEHARTGVSVIIPTGDDVPMDDMDDAKAPELFSSEILASLRTARDRYEKLHVASIKAAPSIREAFSWENMTGKAMEKIV